MTLNQRDKINLEAFECDAALDRLSSGCEPDDSARLMARMMYMAQDAIALGDKDPSRIGAEMAAVGRFLRQWVIHTEPKLQRHQERKRVNCDL